MSTETVRQDKVLRQFQSVQGITYFLVHLEDGGEPRKVPHAAGRKRWKALAAIFDSLDYAKIEAYGKDGLLSVVEGDGRDDDDEEYDDDDDGSDGGRDVGDSIAVARQFTNLLAKCVRETLSEARKMNADNNRANSEVVTQMANAMTAVSDSYHLAMKIQATALASGGGGGDEDSGMKQMMQAALMMMSGGGRSQPAQPPPTRQVPPPAKKNPPITVPAKEG